MENKINFSIVIPHYNMLPKLRRLLDSIPNEDDVEIIIVDDNSDNADVFEVLRKEYSDRNYIFCKNNGKKGAGACRNIGLSNAKGKWVLFADSDDFFRDSMYSTISGFVDSECDLIFFNPTSLNETTNEPATRHLLYSRLIMNYIECPDHYNEIRLRTKMDPPWSKLFKREFLIINRILFDEIIRDNDTMFSAKAGICAKKISASPETIYCCTRHEGSLTTNNTYEHLQIKANVLVRKYFYLKEKLSKRDFDNLDMNGLAFLKSCFFYQRPVHSFITILFLLASNRVRIIPRKIFSIRFWRQYIRGNQFINDYRTSKEAREYYSK